MMRKGAIFAMALALVAVDAVSAGAIGLCFRSENSETFVVKSSRVPGRNKCAPFNGVELSNGGAALSGMGCTSADGGQLIVHYTAHDFSAFPRSRFDSGTCRFPLPFPPGSPQQGHCTGTFVFQAAGTAPYLNRFSELAYLGYCDADVPR